MQKEAHFKGIGFLTVLLSLVVDQVYKTVITAHKGPQWTCLHSVHLGLLCVQLQLAAS